MVRLITDSAADMEAEDYEKNGITCTTSEKPMTLTKE